MNKNVMTDKEIVNPIFISHTEVFVISSLWVDLFLKSSIRQQKALKHFSLSSLRQDLLAEAGLKLHVAKDDPAFYLPASTSCVLGI